MKRFLLLITLILVISISYAQDSTKYVTDTNTEKLIDKYSEKIGDAITALAEKLQQPAEHVYEVLVKQQIVWGVGTLLGIFLGMLVILLGIIGDDKWNWDEDFIIFLEVIGFIVLIISLVLFFLYGLTGLINPEYGALKDIISIIK